MFTSTLRHLSPALRQAAIRGCHATRQRSASYPNALLPAFLLTTYASIYVTPVAQFESPSSSPPKPHDIVPEKAPKNPHLTRYAVADAVQTVIPAVVNIRRVATRQNLSSILFEQDQVGVSLGSGVLISSDGLILTNSHVVSDCTDTESVLHVTLSTGESYIAKLLAADMESDIAIIKVSADQPLPVARLGDSDLVRPGEFVVAVGSPLSLSNSVNFGIVSTIHRDLASNTGESSGGLTYLQLDVAINQGSSGGPCVSLDGEVIGICSMKMAGDVEGIAFAIPIKYVQKVVHDLQTHGYVRRPYVGLTLISVTPHVFDDIRRDTNYRPPRWLESEMRNTNSSKSVGLMVHNIVSGGPGDRAGLKAGDVIVAVNDTSTSTTSEFLAALNFQVNKNCKLIVRRGESGRIELVTIRPELLRNENKLQ